MFHGTERMWLTSIKYNQTQRTENDQRRCVSSIINPPMVWMVSSWKDSSPTRVLSRDWDQIKPSGHATKGEISISHIELPLGIESFEFLEWVAVINANVRCPYQSIWYDRSLPFLLIIFVDLPTTWWRPNTDTSSYKVSSDQLYHFEDGSNITISKPLAWRG